MNARRSIRVGLVGTGISGSLSPALHMAEGTAQGLDYDYAILDLAGGPTDRATLAGRIDGAKAEGLRGLNVTHPFKQMAAGLVDDLSADAEALGAINTIVFENGRASGHNTDWSGYAAGFRRALPDAPLRSVVQLGAGGAGAAVAHALMTMGAERLTIVDRDASRAQSVAQGLASRFGESRVTAGTDPETAMRGADGLVNATPVGMSAYPGLPLPERLLRPTLWVSEIVYFPLETELLKVARRLGCRVSHGGDMAVFQAVEAFRLFTGISPDHERMLAHFAKLQEQRAAVS